MKLDTRKTVRIGAIAVAAVALLTSGVIGTAYANDLNESKTQAEKVSVTSKAYKKKLTSALKKIDDSKVLSYTEPSVMPDDFSDVAKLNGLKTTGSKLTADKNAASDGWKSSYDSKTISDYINTTTKTNKEMSATITQINETISDLQSSHHERLVSDAKSHLKTTLASAKKLLSDTDGRVDDNSSRKTLTDAINSYNENYNDLDSIKSLDSKLSESVKTVNDAVAARNSRIQREQAMTARQQATTTSSASYATVSNRYSGSRSYSNSGSYRSYVSSSYGNRGYSNGSTTAASNTGNSGRSGYSVAGNCYSVSQCQSGLDNGSNYQMQAYHAGGNTTYYGIHSNKGGSDMWGKSSVNINGQNKNLGSWTEATYQNGNPYGPADGKSYVQTCHDGKVYYAPIK